MSTKYRVSGIKYYCERFSNNDQPELTDKEINATSIFLYTICEEQRFKVKQIRKNNFTLIFSLYK